jgi:hypothetical protein
MSKRKRVEEMSKIEKAAHLVHQYQVDYLIDNNLELTCAKEGCQGHLKSDGKGGKSGRAGISLLQVKCKICDSKHRLQNVIIDEKEKAKYLAGLDELLDKAEQANTKQPTLDAFFGKAAKEVTTPGNQEKNDYWDAEPVDEVMTMSVESNQEKILGEEPAEKANHERENLKLKAIIQEQANEINKLKRELETFRKEVRNIVLEEMQKHTQATVENKKEKAQPEAPMTQSSQNKGKTTWADVLTSGKQETKIKPLKTTARKLKDQAQKMLRQAGPPAKFELIAFKLNDSRPLKKCKNFREVSQLMNQFFKSMKIRDLVFQWSKIGNSIVEIMVPENELRTVKIALLDNDLMIIENPKLWEAPPHHTGPWNGDRFIKRKAFLYRTTKLQNMKECIMRRVPADLQQEILEQVAIDRDQWETKLAPITVDTTNTADTGNDAAMDVESNL